MGEARLAPGELAVAELAADARLRVAAAAPGQVAELVVHDADDPRHRLSTLLTSLAEEAYTLRPGMRLWSEEYRPLLRVEAVSTDAHDLMLEACTPWLNRELAPDYRGASCWEAYAGWLGERGLDPKWVPYPVGLFRRVGEHEGAFGLCEATSEPGDSVSFVSESPCVALVTACPLGSRPGAGKHTIEVRWDD